jgi:phosphohistidine swiveling domain-containing protein/membrane-associated phospholipid phosphatase
VFGGPTWADEPELARLAAAPPAPATPITRPEPPGATAARRRFLRREAAEAAALLDRRERTKAALLDLGGIAHRLTVRLGNELSAHGICPRPDDIWLLTHVELHRACADGVPPTDLAARRTSGDVPSAGASGRSPGRPARTAATGWPASAGRARGRAVIVDEHTRSVAPGDVVVARHSDAAWTPLLRHAGAIVVEHGSVLSHAAILAREFAVPAVVGLVGIVDDVEAAIDRDEGPVELDVDGTTGHVVVHTTAPGRIAPIVEPPDDEQRLGVFVTGLVGASAAFLALTSLTGSIADRRVAARTARRAEMPARLSAEFVRCGATAARASRAARRGLPPPATIRRRAIISCGVALVFSAASVRAYVDAEEQRRVLWLAGAMPIAALGVATVVIAVRSARRWPDVDPLLRHIVVAVRSAFTVRWSDLPGRHRHLLTIAATIAVVLLGIVIVTPGVLEPIDESIYDAVGAPSSDPWGPDWLEGVFGRRQVVIPAALAMIVLTIRCRVLATAFATTIAFGGLANLGLGALVGRTRPLLGEHPGRADSFPSGHAVEVTLLLGLLPLAVAVATRSKWTGRGVRFVTTGVLAVMLADGVRDGSHWPTDHAAGFAIAMIAVVAVHAIAVTPGAHLSCTDCPTTALDDRRPEPGVS